MMLTDLSDDALLSAVRTLVASERQLTARLLAHLIVIEDRRLHLKIACSSMFDSCTRRLGMSEGEAFRRITAARLAQRFPAILELIENGSIHLSALTKLRDHLTHENHAELLQAASGKSRRELEELIATWFPKANAPSVIRKVASRQVAATPPVQPTLGLSSPPGNACPPRRPAAPAAPPRSTPQQHSRIEPLAPERYKIQFTADARLKQKLERARNLMSHANPSGDLAVLVERAVDLLLADLEKKKLGKATRPKPARPSKRGAVTRAARRDAFARDGEQCSFTDAEGHRCPAQAFVELDHTQSRALGGTGDAENVRVLCRAHNQLFAEQAFGREHVERQIHLRRRKSAESAETPASERRLSLDAEQRRRSLDALVRLGFQKLQAQLAVDDIGRRESARDLAMQQLLREAILMLTK